MYATYTKKKTYLVGKGHFVPLFEDKSFALFFSPKL